ncbi:MAG: TetR/AcrR family transcriptional regulator [Spirochaetaceae bacterium]|nr:MAG: TetR/AcrR family transcriptional regulator [Spirochaetaceae bacterium]
MSARPRPPDASADAGGDSRARILSCAQELFAQQGFEGARVDEIARRAGVNKALIYYYFRNKQELFDRLVEQFLVESRPIKARLLTRLTRCEAAGDGRKGRDRAANAAVNRMLDFLGQRRSLVTIIFSHAMRGDSDASPLLRYIDASFEDSLAALATAGVRPGRGSSARAVYERRRLQLRSFYSLMMPLLSYVVLEERWAVFYGNSRAEARRCFIELFLESFRTQLVAIDVLDNDT